MAQELAVRKGKQAGLTQWSPERAQQLVDSRKVFEDVRVTVEGGYSAIAKRFIRPTDAERDTLERYLAELESQLMPGKRDVIVAALARLANHRKNDRNEHEWRMLFEDYCEDLEEFSDAHILQAIKEYRRQSNWFPKVAEIRGRCLELQELARVRWRRCRRSLMGSEAA